LCPEETFKNPEVSVENRRIDWSNHRAIRRGSVARDQPPQDGQDRLETHESGFFN